MYGHGSLTTELMILGWILCLVAGGALAAWLVKYLVFPPGRHFTFK